MVAPRLGHTRTALRIHWQSRTAREAAQRKPLWAGNLSYEDRITKDFPNRAMGARGGQRPQARGSVPLARVQNSLHGRRDERRARSIALPPQQVLQ